MNITEIRHIIIIPSTDETATDATLMARLVRQTGHYTGLSLAVLYPNPSDERVTLTTHHLWETLYDKVGSFPSLSKCVYNTPEDTAGKDTNDLARAHFEAALASDSPQAEVMILVTEPRLAGIMPEVILIDILGDDGIISGVSMIIEAGGAATVDCVARSRNVLHPMGTQAWVAETVVGGRPVRPAT